MKKDRKWGRSGNDLHPNMVRTVTKYFAEWEKSHVKCLLWTNLWSYLDSVCVLTRGRWQGCSLMVDNPLRSRGGGRAAEETKTFEGHLVTVMIFIDWLWLICLTMMIWLTMSWLKTNASTGCEVWDPGVHMTTTSVKLPVKSIETVIPYQLCKEVTVMWGHVTNHFTTELPNQEIYLKMAQH